MPEDASPRPPRIHIGTAGWNVPRHATERFPPPGTHLERYARTLNCAEINSSFYRPHAFKTYAKWAASTPLGFQFAVKLPRTITHEQKLLRPRLPLQQFLEETSGLGEKRGPILIQLPPSLAFDARVAGRFFDLLRQLYLGESVCEPRHPSWLTPAAEAMLVRFQIGRVAADPPRAAGADTPGGWPGIVYFRLHGAPRMYWSRYSEADIQVLAGKLRGLSGRLKAAPTQGGSKDPPLPTTAAWCVFDNTASGAAIENAYELHALLDSLDAPV